MTVRRLFIPLIVLFGSALAQAAETNYALRPARGLAIYQKNNSLSDSTAVLIEYLSFKAHDRVSYLITVKGNRLTIPVRGASLLLLPYPGKGEASPAEAMAVIEYAQDRYPQYRAHIRPLKAAWLKESTRPAEEIQKEIAVREKNKDIGAAFVGWLKSLTPSQPPPKLPPSPLKSPELRKPSEPKAPVENSQPEENGSAQPNPLDVKGNFEKLKDYYNTDTGS